ncbi:bifunctional DNA-formamidopyrimidine glycosylase/DNA-(apurinic or apyrimidinic site) lyase [Candidatus Peregrinibacteria bacterium]|nr:bifunctional DNA-formamidopyrimidine glycosylase/DNA-(apurinic or apyrimidinic site) lyase [Candidatus Peregrinibacteria bacterium]
MPELPEVETIVNDLKPILVGRRFLSITSTHDNHVAGALDNAERVVDKAVAAVRRRGKFICIFFENDFVMTVHLRMSGRLLWRDTDESALMFERTRIDFDAGSLRFCDMRKFGRVWISALADYEGNTGIARLGIEPLSKEFTLEKFVMLLMGKRGIVKKWLLDQGLIAGIGNIYADEGCFYAGVSPGAMVEELSQLDLERLFEGVLKALRQGVRNRGTSISDFADAYGKSGHNQELLYVYGRGGKPCLKCGSALVKSRLAGRGTVYCGQCQ